MKRECKMDKVLNTIRKNREKEEELAYCRKGYWLVRESDKERFFISEHVNEDKLELVCDKVLSDKTGYGYWIDYCWGLDITGRIEWSNLDFTEHFI